MYYVYLLKLSNNDHYVGFSENLQTRIKDHHEGKCSTTAKFRPVELVWYCGFKDKYKALKFESYLKKGTGHAFRNKHLE
ncbi:MAG: GIY-YIG nuclease family protein [Patescibacteria group bacterium]